MGHKVPQKTATLFVAVIFCSLVRASFIADSNENVTCDFGTTCFSKNYCGFSWPTGSLDWDCQTGRTTLQATTGPERDHTGKGGAYLFASARRPTKGASKFELWSPSIVRPSGAKTGCVSLYYYMHGVDVSALSVYANYSAKLPRQLVWTASGPQGKEWFRMERNLDFPSDAAPEFLIVIEATMPNMTGSGVAGDIAIDDLSISASDKCPTPTGGVTPSAGLQRTPTESAPPQLLGGSPTTLVPTECGSSENAACDFGVTCFTKNYCGFSWPAGSLDWNCQTSRTTAFATTGPERDHTGKGGAYLFASSRKPTKGASKFELWSPPIVRSSGAKTGCVSLYYYMHGVDVATLSVYANYSAKLSRQLVWAATGPQGQEWFRMERNLDFPSDAEPEFRIIIEATMPNMTGSGVAGDIAIDDLYISASYPCPPTEKRLVPDCITTPTIPTSTSSRPTTPTERPTRPTTAARERICGVNENMFKAVRGTGCTKFTQFTWKGDVGDHRCPLGLLFDSDRCICNWASAAVCRTP